MYLNDSKKYSEANQKICYNANSKPPIKNIKNFYDDAGVDVSFKSSISKVKKSLSCSVLDIGHWTVHWASFSICFPFKDTWLRGQK